MLRRKIFLTVLAHVFWLGLLLFCEINREINPNELYDFLSRPYMTAIVYPLVVNMFVIQIYKIKPLESEKDKVKFIWITVFLTVYLIVRGIGEYMYSGLYY